MREQREQENHQGREAGEPEGVYGRGEGERG